MRNDVHILDKLDKLKYRVSFATSGTQKLEELNDMKWIKRKIEDFDGGIVLDKRDLKNANRLWKKYEYAFLSDKDDKWSMIDEFIKNGEKITAIKLFRNSPAFLGQPRGLREAKETIDARELKIKGMV